MQPFDYVVPRSHMEASDLLASANGRASALQGGTDLFIRIRGGLVQPDLVVDLKELPGMQQIREGPDGWLAIGAACTMNQVARHPLVCRHFGLLAQACNSVASYQLRNRATVGGNCCNGSPAADTAPALYCLGAVAEIFGHAGQRRIPIESFFLGPGLTALGPGEFLTAILLPQPETGAHGVFHKLGRTRAGDISIASVAVYTLLESIDSPGEEGGHRVWRLVLGAVGPTPVRVRAVEESLEADISPAGIAAAASHAARMARPIDDVRASAAYRAAMVEVLTRRGLHDVLQQLERST
jgi:CO/xanthine dehydrogenase FAD-binding subunit